MGKLNVPYSGDETDASVQRGEFSPKFLFEISVFVDPFLKILPAQTRARAGPEPGPDLIFSQPGQTRARPGSGAILD